MVKLKVKLTFAKEEEAQEINKLNDVASLICMIKGIGQRVSSEVNGTELHEIWEANGLNAADALVHATGEAVKTVEGARLEVTYV